MFDIKKPSAIKRALIFFEILVVLIMAVALPPSAVGDVKPFYADGAEKFICKEGYGLYIDGTFIAACDSRQSVDNALASVAAVAAEASGAPEGVHTLRNDVKVIADSYAKSVFVDSGNLERLLGKTDGGFVYSVYTANGAVCDVALSVSTVCVLESEEVAGPEIVIVETDLLPVGESVVVSEGKAGINSNFYRVTYTDGVESNRTLIGSVVLSSAVNGEKWCGTESGATLMSASDKFMMPCGGRVTSWYGYRTLWGSKNNHSGIDFAGEGGSYGDPIYAAEDGIVSYAGFHGNYGKKITLDHSKQITTLYAHCSKIIVNEGDVVRKGQIIGYIGNTGNVTGPHLHFEVYINDARVNPKTYLDWTEYAWGTVN